MKYSAVIVAAGKGSRSGLSINKVYSKINDKYVIQHSMDLFLNDPDCDQVIVVVNVNEFNTYFPHYYDQRVIVVKGGATRQHSVLNGVCACTNELVMIHDGARPFITQTIVDNCKQALQSHDSALVCMPCADTIKYGVDKIEKTLDRSTLYIAQTPQCFHTTQYLMAAKQAIDDGVSVTDDCQVMELYGSDDIAIVTGSSKNVKLTWPTDFE